VRAILFEGTVRLKETLVPLMATAEYRHAPTGAVISQVASFEPQSIHGMKVTMEMHKIGETGETHIILRRMAD
jgi:hypothetical protein